MKFGIKYRFVALLLAVAVMGASILLVTLYSQRQAGDLRIRLSQVESESFRIADEFRDHFRGLNNLLQRYGIEHDTGIWKEFLESSHKLNGWLSEQKPRLTTQREKMALQEIDAAYKEYLETANEVQVKVSSLGQRSASLADFNPLRAQTQHIFDLGQTLMKAHYDSRKELLNEANITLTHLKWLVLTALGLLFLFGLAMAAVVYRDMIAPLRVKLVESQSLIERHEKLASLGMLAAGVAHEIRNPLTAIKAALFIQQKKFLPGSQEHTDAKLVER